MSLDATAGTKPSPLPDGAIIRRLRIERFRGMDKFDWWPKPGLNVILGGGDTGKTTILEAIALLLSPSNATIVSENDYWQRQRIDGFFIGAVLTLPESSEVSAQSRPVWPWEWNGREACAPQDTDDGSPRQTLGPPVYKFAVTGTDELDLNYEIMNPNGSVDAFSANLRRDIGLVRLGGDDRNDRDLRLVQGSALDRLLSDKALRSRLTATFSDDEVKAVLRDEAQAALAALDITFEDRALPHGLGLGLNTAQGQSISALIGLTATAATSRLPLSSWGSGTRRLASLAVAQACRSGCPITLVDEAERGLEPYRQRKLVAELAAGPSQVIMTTHSAAALAAAEPATIWHLAHDHTIGEMATDKIGKLQLRDPEAFLARLAVVGEGPTEVGFLSFTLEKELTSDVLNLGIRLCDGQGNHFTLELLEEFSRANFAIAGFVDHEGDNQQRWAKLQSGLGDLLFQWPAGCTEENVIVHVARDRLEALITDPDDALTQPRLNTLVDRLRQRHADAVFPKHDFATIAAVAGSTLKDVIIAAASGKSDGAPVGQEKIWKKHGKSWFKTVAGGRELASKAYALGAMQQITPQLAPFVEALQAATDVAPKVKDSG